MTNPTPGASAKTSRFYFPASRLHHAYSMYKDFGMQFTRTHCHRGDGKFGESMRPIPQFVFGRDIENQVSEHVRYYIHPDSLHLLELQVGDGLLVTREDGSRDFFRVYNEGWLLIITTRWPVQFPKLKWEIIQRNGMAFELPESEEV